MGSTGKLLLILTWCGTGLACNDSKHMTPYEAEHVKEIRTGKTTPLELVGFACSLAGKPYCYGSSDPESGFDCSGFMTYVFNHFNIQVPRTTTDFMQVHSEVALKDAKLGDLIFFTGTDRTNRIAGHMGIISSLPGEPLRFMHAASGKSAGVMETDFHTAYFEARYLKTVRIFQEVDN